MRSLEGISYNTEVREVESNKLLDSREGFKSTAEALTDHRSCEDRKKGVTTAVANPDLSEKVLDRERDAVNDLLWSYV